jgi:hypothetical protein
MAENGKNGNGQQQNPAAGLANFMNMMAPHNVLRMFVQAVPPPPGLPALPAMAAGGQNGQQPALPAAAPGMPEGTRTRFAKRKGMSAEQYATDQVAMKRASETAGFSVEGKTIIF